MDPNMLNMLWDTPMVSRIAFQARSVPQGQGLKDGESDGVIEVQPDVTLGYRLYNNVKDPRVVVIFFHGNAEVCTDISFFIEEFYRLYAVVLSIDYRGYGWSTGSAQFSTLCSDADCAADKIPTILQDAGLSGLPLILHGRSIGATCAVHLAATRPKQFKGIIIESGLMTVKDLPLIRPILCMMPNMEQLLPLVKEPVGTLEKMKDLRIPTLIVHGDEDEIVPFSQAQAAFANCAAAVKKLEKIAGGGHNDLHSSATILRVAFKWLYDAACAPPLGKDQVPGLSVKQLKQELEKRNVDSSHCVEKSELVALLLSNLP